VSLEDTRTPRDRETLKFGHFVSVVILVVRCGQTMSNEEGRARAAHIHHQAEAGQSQTAAAAALPSSLPAFSSAFRFLGLPRHEAAAPATMPPMVPYWPLGATPSTMRSTNMSEACLLPVPLPVYMPGLQVVTTGGPSAVAPAWGFQHHAQGSAAAGIAQVAAPASASEQPGPMNSSSDDDSSSPAKKPKKKGRSATSLKSDSEAIEVRRERNRVNAKQSRLRKKERIQQVEAEVAGYKQQLAAYREQEVATQHGAQGQLQGVVPVPDPALYQNVSTQTQASINYDDPQQAEHCLNTQWAVLDCFFKWLCSSASCTDLQWASFAEQSCVLWLPVGSVENTAATREAAQQHRTLVRFTGPAEILNYGRQHFLQPATRAQAAATATATTAGVGGTATAIATTAAAAAKTVPDVRLQVAVERREMYKRCSDIMNRSSYSMYIAAPFLCKNAATQGDGVVGVAVCKFVTESAASNAQRLSGVNLLYDTCAMSRLLAAAATRYSASTTCS
jgi:hypothetical protein